MTSGLHAQMLRELNHLISELGSVQDMGILQAVVEEFAHHGYASPILIDIYAREEKFKSEFHALRKWLLADSGKVSFRVIDPSSPPTHKVGTALPALALWIVDEVANQDQALKGLFSENRKFYLKILGLNPDGIQHAAPIAGLEFLPGPADETNRSFFDQVDALLPGTVKQTVKDRETWNAFFPVLDYLQGVIQGENRLLNLRRNLQLQGAQLAKTREQAGNSNELAASLRAAVTSWSQDLEKALRVKYEEHQRPNIGTYAVLSSQYTAGFTGLETFDLAEKSERVGVRIPEEYLSAVMGNLRHQLLSDFRADLMKLDQEKNRLLSLLQEIAVKKGNGARLQLGQQLPSYPNLDKTIQTYGVFSKNYQGEMVKRGKMEYFVAIRDYTGVIMVVGGLLSPLTIIANAADSPIFKSMGTGLRVTIAALTFLMVIYGFVDLRRRIPKKRREEEERELGKAKDLLSSETRKVLMDSSKEWQTLMIQHLREISSAIQSDIELFIKGLQGDQMSKVQEERSKLEKQKIALESIQKRLSSAEKVHLDMTRAYRDKPPVISTR